ncbi:MULTISPECIES: LLM class F420-dependent oxidoreductase [Thermomonospora]|uniref:Luciferase-like monooxygenase n=1 Tax=Thermomonospora curvata (strain ATCC 19995 / DSM 43183 / JCM 3096 / KCTC 9072 / NBRC 15933 / NCIMB 10081 / Henssen B9) TaxID=471852 RepID=D1ABS8_THECD|nr:MULTISPECIES: LLM class F420-dependent oxidoreductase [Thermomonospora]ACY99101.1 Luciferase-like monooxygenase [Thermomonospora curvata DSM 43183]PKK13282.1 MAG: TIGR03619 family F420-dependent LLM class oxidoreductase [Thermomonospora sp. CIF 1]
MEFGVSAFITDEGIGPAALGRALEERGFTSLFVAEHTHIPVKRESPWPGGAEMPRWYYRTFDPFVALTAVAAATERLRVGTGIALVIQRDPIILAKEVASLDRVSNGRAVLGVGAGWNREEMRNHGTDPRTRMALLRERVLAVKELWTKDEAAFHGEFVNFDPVFCYPKPVQDPHPPILVGGSGPTVFDRVIEYGDGWMPIYGRIPGDTAEQIARLRERAGRRVPVLMFGVPPKPQVIEELREAGVDEILFGIPTEPKDATLARLDKIAELISS